MTITYVCPRCASRDTIRLIHSPHGDLRCLECFLEFSKELSAIREMERQMRRLKPV